jgi:curli biogenesis system outer membrane secretion channel CsgG
MRAAIIAAAVALLPATTHAATRTDVANEARAITTQLAECEHPSATVSLAYLQARKGVETVQMSTRIYPYTPYPTEQDIANVVALVVPAPRTTNSRLLGTGHEWLQRARVTLETAGVCS